MNIKKYLTKEQLLTIPSALSLFRLLLIPLLICLYVGEERPYAALAMALVLYVQYYCRMIFRIRSGA